MSRNLRDRVSLESFGFLEVEQGIDNAMRGPAARERLVGDFRNAPYRPEG